MVEQIAAGSQLAVGELYQRLRRFRFFFSRQVGPDRAEDAYHNFILNLVAAVRKGNPREPETLPAYAMTIARREVFARIRQATRERQEVDSQDVDLRSAVSEIPEQIALRAEREAIARRVLTALPPRQREVLTRFYLYGQTEEEIRTATGLSANQFRLIKSRAKQRYTDLVKEVMNKGRQPKGRLTADTAEIQPPFRRCSPIPCQRLASRAPAPSLAKG